MNVRHGSSNDINWLYDLFKTTLKEYIDATWGWDEVFQQEAFLANLPGENFSILESDGEPVAAYYLENREDHLWLELLLVVPEKQLEGHGQFLLRVVQTQAMQANKPLRLNVLKVNPALDFYLKQGFEVVAEDEHRFKLDWLP